MRINKVWKSTGIVWVLYLVIMASCARPAHSNNNKKAYLPTFLKEIQLGQEQAAVLQSRPKAYPVNSFAVTNWQQFTEDVDQDGITSAYYNFEKIGKKRLVSIELLHRQANAAKATFENFGGTVSSDNPKERSRTTQETIYATQQGNRVIFSLPIALKKNMPSADQ